jgi:Sensors of blue-light using FAD
MSSAKLHRLIYCSKARLDVMGSIEAALPEILSVAQKRNSAVNVTGALLCCDGWFLQALEGPMVNVLETYGRVMRDPRHDGLTLVEATPTRERLFSQWSMCGLSLSPVDKQIVKTLESNDGFHQARIRPQSALKLLGTVRQIQSKRLNSVPA